MKKTLFILMLSLQSLFGVDLSYGKGNFDFSFGLNGGMNANVGLDIDLLSLRENHLSLSQNFFLYGNVDIYQSKTVDGYAAYFEQAANFNPFGPSSSDVIGEFTPIPIPVSYKMRGIDMNIGVGYDIVKQEGSYLSVGIGTGFSMPYVETQNIVNDAQNVSETLQETKTEIMTYKLLPSLHGAYVFVPGLKVQGSLQYGYQFGTVENEYINGEGDISGTNLSTDIRLEYATFVNSSSWKVFYLTAGYRYNDWSVDDMKVSVINPMLSIDMMQTLSMGFSSDFAYFGAGYSF